MKGYELKEHRRLTMSQLHEFSRLEERRVVGAVEDLVESGVVEASGSGVSRSYILSSKVYKADNALPAYARQNNISATRQRGMVLKLAEKKWWRGYLFGSHGFVGFELYQRIPSSQENGG